MERLLIAGKDYIELPQSWDEVSFKQFLDLSQSDNLDLAAVSILTGISKSQWADSKNINLYYYCMDSLSKWVKQGIGEINDKQLNRLKFLTKDIDLGDIGEETVAQYEDMKIIMGKYTVEYQTSPIEAMRKYYPTIAAIYLQPKASGERYDHSKAIKLNDQINELPAPMVIGVVNFFLLKYIGSRTGIGQGAQVPSSRLKRWMQGLVKFIRRLALRLYLTHWQKEILKRKIILNG